MKNDKIILKGMHIAFYDKKACKDIAEEFEVNASSTTHTYLHQIDELCFELIEKPFFGRSKYADYWTDRLLLRVEKNLSHIISSIIVAYDIHYFATIPGQLDTFKYPIRKEIKTELFDLYDRKIGDTPKIKWSYPVLFGNTRKIRFDTIRRIL